MQSLRVPLTQSAGDEAKGLTLAEKGEVINDLMSILLAPNQDFEVDFTDTAKGQQEVSITLINNTFSAYIIDELPKYRINEKLHDSKLFAIDCGAFGDLFSRLSCACLVKGNEIVIRTCIDDIFLTLTVETFSTDPAIMEAYLDAAHGYSNCAIAFVQGSGDLTDVIRQVRDRASSGAVYYVNRLIRNQSYGMYDQTLSNENGVYY